MLNNVIKQAAWFSSLVVIYTVLFIAGFSSAPLTALSRALFSAAAQGWLDIPPL